MGIGLYRVVQFSDFSVEKDYVRGMESLHTFSSSFLTISFRQVQKRHCSSVRSRLILCQIFGMQLFWFNSAPCFDNQLKWRWSKYPSSWNYLWFPKNYQHDVPVPVTISLSSCLRTCYLMNLLFIWTSCSYKFLWTSCLFFIAWTLSFPSYSDLSFNLDKRGIISTSLLIFFY